MKPCKKGELELSEYQWWFLPIRSMNKCRKCLCLDLKLLLMKWICSVPKSDIGTKKKQIKEPKIFECKTVLKFLICLETTIIIQLIYIHT